MEHPQISIDPDEWSLDDMECVEEYTGKFFSEAVEDAQKGSARALKAMAFVAMRRTNPDITMAEVGDVRPATDFAVTDPKDKPGARK